MSTAYAPTPPTAVVIENHEDTPRLLGFAPE